MAEITFDGVSKVYPGGVRAVDGVSFTVADGEFVALVGPSGCGKSTILRMAAGLERATEGAIRIGGRDVTALPPKDRDVAMVFQDYALYPQMTVRQNLSFGLKVRRRPRAEIVQRVEDVARSVGLGELLDRKPGQLSGGQRQRVAIGRAIIRDPVAFLMDEPLSNLDANLRTHMRNELERLRATFPVTTMYVTHDQVEAMTLGDRVIVVDRGAIQQVDSPQRLYERPRNTFVAATIGAPAMNLVELDVRDGAVHLADAAIALPDAVRSRAPGRVIVGVRPSDFCDARPGLPPAHAALTVDAEIVEVLGAERRVLFAVPGRAVRTHALGTAALASGEDEEAASAGDRAVRVTASVDGASGIASGDRVLLGVRTGALHYFDADTHDAISSPPDRS